MKSCLLFAILMLTTTLQAQIEMSPSELYKEFELVNGVDQEIIDYGLMINNADAATQFRWVKEVLYIPDNWDVAFCDKQRCWLPTVDEGTVSLDAGESGTADVHIYTNTAPGDSAVVRMCVYEVENENNFSCATYTFVNTNVLPVDDLGNEVEVSLFPNPARDYFKVRTEASYEKIILYNIVGTPVKTYPSSEDYCELNGLPSGMYLARIFTEQGNILTTIRLHKR